MPDVTLVLKTVAQLQEGDEIYLPPWPYRLVVYQIKPVPAGLVTVVTTDGQEGIFLAGSMFYVKED